jgi:glycosyltransferase involved in cell wall biosynthesis
MSLLPSRILNRFKSALRRFLQEPGQLADLSSQLADLSSQQAALSSQLADLSSQPATLSSQLADLSSQLAELSSQPAMLSNQLNNAIASLQNCQDITLDLCKDLSNRTCLQTMALEQTPFDLRVFETGDYHLAFVSNLANFHYAAAKALRKKKINVRLLYEPKFNDNYVMSRPAWEDIYEIFDETPSPDLVESKWESPDFCIACDYNTKWSSFSKPFDYQAMNGLLEGSGLNVNDPVSYYKMMTIMPHLGILKQMSQADVLQVSGTLIGVASLLNKPYVTFPYGGDLYIYPFVDNITGWRQVQGFRRAQMHIASGKLMVDYFIKLGVNQNKIALLPLMFDTDAYAPGAFPSIRADIKSLYPNKIIFFMGARQNWLWKGNDKFFRALARIPNKIERLVVLCPWWGQDMKQSEKLLTELGLNEVVVKLGMLTKGAMRQYIEASDLCLDQFTLGSIGTYSLEAMSLGKPLLVNYDPQKHFDFSETAPVMNVSDEDEIFETLLAVCDNKVELSTLGQKARQWVKQYHSIEALWPEYDRVYRTAIAQFKFS